MPCQDKMSNPFKIISNDSTCNACGGKKRYITMACRISFLTGTQSVGFKSNDCLAALLVCLFACLKLAQSAPLFSAFTSARHLVCFLWAKIHSFLGKMLLQVLIRKSVRSFFRLFIKSIFLLESLIVLVFSLRSTHLFPEQLHDFPVNFTVHTLFLDHLPMSLSSVLLQWGKEFTHLTGIYPALCCYLLWPPGNGAHEVYEHKYQCRNLAGTQSPLWK